MIDKEPKYSSNFDIFVCGVILCASLALGTITVSAVVAHLKQLNKAEVTHVK